jgi:Transposase DDE domain group 1
VLDIDSSVSPTLGEQEMACFCYHPLFVFNQFGDLERCALRPGNVHSADGWKEVLDPVVARYRGKVSRMYSAPTRASLTLKTRSSPRSPSTTCRAIASPRG